MTFIISFDNSEWMGGLGDRIVGLISVKLISTLLNKNFFINWTRENINEIIDISKYDFQKQNLDVKNFRNVKIMNGNFRIPFIQFLENGTISDFQKTNNILFHCNFECSKFLFNNNNFKKINYQNTILDLYKTLYTDIIKIKNKNIIHDIIDNKTNIIGIQIRVGRKDWKEKCANVINEAKGFLYDKDVENYIMHIKNHIEKTTNYYYVFVTSDHENIYKISKNIFGDKVLYYDLEITHIDRNPNLNTIQKIFIDNYILSQHTNKIYISSYSNFGRIAALSSNHNEIYDSSNCKKLNKINLLSKH